MILLAAAFLAASEPVVIGAPPVAEPSLSEAAHAIEAGRLDQAKAMIAAAVAAGARGELVDRLMADLALARGDYSQAYATYQLLVNAHPRESLLLERAGIAALHLDRIADATALLDRATGEANASWRAWNARGVAADRDGRWSEAAAAYDRAAAIGPGHAEVANNRGWSMMLQGRWAVALREFEQAAAMAPDMPLLANNLALARAAVDADLPPRQSGETDDDYAARLNDAGVVAQSAGDKAKAEAAFAQAIQLRSRWYAKAAQNLASLEAAR